MSAANRLGGVNDLWATIPIEAGQIYRGRFGHRVVWVKEQEGDWYVADELRSDEGADEPLQSDSGPPPATPWMRWASPDAPSSLTISPILPDRPLVVRPSEVLRIPAGVTASVYLEIPLWIRLSVGDGVSLCELSVAALSNTWFGSPVVGELCYSLLSPTRRQIGPVSSWQAVCPVVIGNASARELEFRRLCVHVEYLSLYAVDSRLQTNGVTFLFQGEEDEAQVVLSKAPPLGRLVCDPRVVAKENFLNQGFSFLKSVADL